MYRAKQGYEVLQIADTADSHASSDSCCLRWHAEKILTLTTKVHHIIIRHLAFPASYLFTNGISLKYANLLRVNHSISRGHIFYFPLDAGVKLSSRLVALGLNQCLHSYNRDRSQMAGMKNYLDVNINLSL